MNAGQFCVFWPIFPRMESSKNAYPVKRMNWGSFSKSLSRDAEPYEDLSAFGYTAKVYYDSEKYAWIQSGRHLIPWMGHEELLIDRYDARGYLNDLSLYDSKQLSKQPNVQLTDEELELERLLNIERFADLKDDEETEEAANDDAVSGGQYSNVGYHYKNSDKMAERENGHVKKVEEKEKDIFKVPFGLNILPNLTLPETNKHHFIIERTASFVAQQGSQMEILLKTKQSSNSSFDFLSIDSPLNPYYKFLLNEIKTGKYSPKANNGQESDKDSDDDSDGNYLHPSLLSSKSQNNKVKLAHLTNVFSKSSEEGSYSQLVKHFKDNFAEDIAEDTNSSEKSPSSSNESPSTVTSRIKSVSSLIPQPPSDIEAIIIKLAEHVGKNGDEFEKSIKALGDKKFEFLNPGHIYHAFYVKLKISEIAKHRKLLKKPEVSKIDRAIAFSITTKEPPKKIYPNSTITKALKDGTHQMTVSKKGDTTLLSKEQILQNERKKKALEFINLLRKEKSIDSETISYGPEMPKDKIQLSPTIEEITSPSHSPTDFSQKSEFKKEKAFLPKNASVLPFTTDDALIKDRSLSPLQRRSLSPPRRYKLENDDDESPDRTPSRYHRRGSSCSRKKRHRSRSRSKDRKRHHKHKSHKSSHRSSRRSRSRSKSQSRSPTRKSNSPHDNDKHRSKKKRHESSRSHRKHHRSRSPS